MATIGAKVTPIKTYDGTGVVTGCVYEVIGTDVLYEDENDSIGHMVHAIKQVDPPKLGVYYASDSNLIEVEDVSLLDSFELITREMHELYVRKNHDYGDSFATTYDKLGIISAVTRMSDKMERLISLSTKPQKVSDESIQDTLIDIANYAVMTLMQLRK